MLVAGSSLAINWEDEHIPAIIDAWYPGEQGGTAVAEVLFGDYNPGGRLPLTFYKSLADLPAFDDYDITNNRTYRYFDGEVLYPFGYGLSYTKFKYGDIDVKDTGDCLEVSFSLKNTGKYDGDEVAQVYVNMSEYGGIAPKKELKGFKRVALKRGESKRVTIPIDKKQLRYWNVEDSKFVTPEGDYVISVGGSSEDLNIYKVFTLTGAGRPYDSK